MKLVVHPKAADDLDGIFTWIAKDNPASALGIVRRIRRRIGRLATPGLAHIGRPGLVAGTRELIEPPYIVVYTVDEDRNELTIVAIFHGAQDRPTGS
jgi:toxin ParE1/3/4